jgi:hypothetical protein
MEAVLTQLAALLATQSAERNLAKTGRGHQEIQPVNCKILDKSNSLIIMGV